MTIRSKIATAALGLLIATGAAAAQTGTAPTIGTVQSTAPITTKAPVKTAKVAPAQHRVRMSHHKPLRAKIAHRSIRAKVAHTLGLKSVAGKHAANVHVAKKQRIAKLKLVGTRKHV